MRSATPPLTVKLREDVRVLDQGSLLVGGSPLVAISLTEQARSILGSGPFTVQDDASALLADRLLAANIADPVLEGQAVTPSDLTVVIPVRDRPEQLDRLLACLRPMLRCVVVDDGSRRPADVAAVTTRRGADLLPLPHNLGPAAARNAGLAVVDTEYVAFVDSDVEVLPEDLLALTRGFADPRVVLVGPRVRGRSVSARPGWYEQYDSASGSLDLGGQPASVRPGARVAWLPSACLVGRTKSIRPGFDPELRVGEDVDLVWRLVAARHRVRYDPSVSVLHDSRSTLRSWAGRKFLYGTGGALLAGRHGSAVAPAILSPEYAVAAAGLLLGGRWSVPVAAVAVAQAAHRVSASTDRRTGWSIATEGLVWAVRQEAALVVRHWWPAAALGCLTSRRARRAAVIALAVDSVVTLHEHPGQPPLRLMAGRRLDDLAYGAGLWWGALREREPRVLAIRLVRRTRKHAQHKSAMSAAN